jgi:hypothetical protein
MSKARRVKKMAKRRAELLRRVRGGAPYLFTTSYIRIGDTVIATGSSQPNVAINFDSALERLYSKPSECQITIPYQVI